MSVRLASFGLLLFSCALMAAQTAEPVLVLDLRKMSVPQEDVRWGCGMEIRAEVTTDTGGEFEDPNKSPFELDVLPLEKDTYRLGESFVLQAILRNVTEESVDIPVETDWRRLKADPQPPGPPGGCIWDMLHLLYIPQEGKTENGSNPSFLFVVFWGAPSVPGTIRTLGPGEAIQFIVPVTWNHPRQNGLPVSLRLPLKMDFQALFNTMRPPSERYFKNNTFSKPGTIQLLPAETLGNNLEGRN